jgi:hypothetical protein
MNPLSRRLGRIALLAVGLASMAPALAQTQRKLDQEHLAGHWILLNTAISADVPNSGRNMDKPGCVAVSYSIGSDGLPRNITVRKVMPPSDLGPVAASAVGSFRYGPSLSNRNGDPVDTYYIVPFNLPADPAARKQLVDACKLPGYGD